MAKIPPERIDIYTDISIMDKEVFGMGIRIRDIDRKIILWNYGTQMDFKKRYPDSEYHLSTLNAELEAIFQAVARTVGQYGQSHKLSIIIYTNCKEAKSLLKYYKKKDPFIYRYVRFIKKMKQRHSIEFSILSQSGIDKHSIPDHVCVHELARKFRIKQLN